MALNEELIRSNNDLQQFDYVASHDLQEPLRMVSSFTQLLEKQYGSSLDENAREYIRFAVEGSQRMYDLINGLLTYSRVQTRAREFENVDMNVVIDKVMANLHLVLKEKKVVIRCEKLPVVSADESQMIQLVQNLIENGIKFNRQTPVINISCSTHDNYEVFSIKDNGIGIEKQYHERIFRIFQKLHLSSDYKGTGIGLAICKRIIDRHGGKVWVDSVPGKGSAFYFSVPVSRQLLI